MSATVTVCTLTAAPVGFAALAAVAVNLGSVYVAWSDPFTNNGVLVGFGVWRNGTLVQYVTSTSRAFTDSGLTPFTLYAYSVNAVNSAGQAFNAVALVRTPAAPPTGFAAPVQLNASKGNALLRTLNLRICHLRTSNLRKL